ncbi:MAG TPA: DMT family transporter [Polyangiaceae bacterium]|nr:DMT family transporter [Polyangiaceae bacterium]
MPGEVPRQAPEAVPLRVHAVLVLVQAAFSTLSVLGKIAMGPTHHVSPSALAMARIVGGAIFFGALHLGLRSPRVNRLWDVAVLAVLALFGVVLNQALFLAGLHKTSPISAILLVATIPVFTAAISAITGRARLSLRAASGILLALFGAAYLTGFAVPHLGDALVILNALSYAVFTVYAKSLLARYGSVTVVAWIFGLGALLFAPIGGLTLGRELTAWPQVTGWLVALIVLVPTVLGYAGNVWALEKAPPTVVSAYVYLQPVIVAVLAWIVLGQALDMRAVVAGIFIFGGVGIVATSPPPLKVSTEAPPPA